MNPVSGVRLAQAQHSSGVKERQDGDLENHTSAEMALTHYPGTTNAVKHGQVVCVPVKKVPVCLAGSGGSRFMLYGQALTAALRLILFFLWTLHHRFLDSPVSFFYW